MSSEGLLGSIFCPALAPTRSRRHLEQYIIESCCKAFQYRTRDIHGASLSGWWSTCAIFNAVGLKVTRQLFDSRQAGRRSCLNRGFCLCLHEACKKMSSTSETVAPAECLGPAYRPQDQKPTATISTGIPLDNVHILAQTPQLIALLTYGRNPAANSELMVVQA